MICTFLFCLVFIMNDVCSKLLSYEDSAGDLKIVGKYLTDDTIASAYTEHTFYIRSLEPVTDYYWEYKLQSNSGDFVAVATSASEEFIIPAITNESIYQTDLDGCIDGLITFKGVSNGKKITAQYNLTLDLKPRILNAEIVSITPSNNYVDFYDAIIDVFYLGSRYLYSYIEEEYSSYMNTYYSETPDYSRLSFGDIDASGYALVNIIIRNDYGSDSIVLTIPKQLEKEEGSTTVEEVKNETISVIKVFNINGLYLGEVNSYDELQRYSFDILILKLYKNNEYVKTIKYIRRNS